MTADAEGLAGVVRRLEYRLRVMASQGSKSLSASAVKILPIAGACIPADLESVSCQSWRLKAGRDASTPAEEIDHQRTAARDRRQLLRDILTA